MKTRTRKTCHCQEEKLDQTKEPIGLQTNSGTCLKYWTEEQRCILFVYLLLFGFTGSIRTCRTKQTQKELYGLKNILSIKSFLFPLYFHISSIGAGLFIFSSRFTLKRVGLIWTAGPHLNLEGAPIALCQASLGVIIPTIMLLQ